MAKNTDHNTGLTHPAPNNNGIPDLILKGPWRYQGGLEQKGILNFLLKYKLIRIPILNLLFDFRSLVLVVIIKKPLKSSLFIISLILRVHNLHEIISGRGILRTLISNIGEMAYSLFKVVLENKFAFYH